MPLDVRGPIAVAVSGGADSLLALALLAEAGYEVFGLHALLLPEDSPQAPDIGALEKACRSLGAELRVADLRAVFRARVVEPFIQGYASGATPNPCTTCNPRIKFGALWDEASRLGAARLATGHYARLLTPGDGAPLLARGLDPDRDQSYFLSLVPRGQMSMAVFPLAEELKSRVVPALEARGASPVVRHESREICFVPGDDYRAFLQAGDHDLSGPGPVELADGTWLGNHQGLWRHTLGQRRGLGIAWSEPLYVLDKDIPRNALIVGPAHDLASSGLRAKNVNLWMEPEDWPDQVLVQTRYRQEARPARARLEDGELEVEFVAPQTRPTPGQVAVVYDAEDRVLAAGVIR